MKLIEESIETYHASSALNRSKLLRLKRSPKYYKWTEAHPEEPTQALIFGNAVHTFILQPEEFDKRYVIAPECDKRTTAGKLVWKDFISNCGEKIILTKDEYITIQGICDSINNNPYAKKLLSGNIEKSFYWTDDLTGLKVKTRPDSYLELTKHVICADLKTCASADTESFQRDALKHGYDVQSFMCSYALEKYYKKPVTFLFVAVEKTPPYSINIMQVDDLFKQRGEDIYRELLGTYKLCKDTKIWADYNGENGRFNELSVPIWMQKDYE